MSILRTTVNDNNITQERVPYQAAHILVQKDYIIHQGKHITLMKTDKLTLANSCSDCSLLYMQYGRVCICCYSVALFPREVLIFWAEVNREGRAHVGLGRLDSRLHRRITP